MDNRSRNLSMEQAMRLAASPAGQQLLALLKSAGGENVEKARQQAQKGDLDRAQDTLRGLMDDPRIRQLLQQLEQSHG